LLGHAQCHKSGTALVTKCSRSYFGVRREGQREGCAPGARTKNSIDNSVLGTDFGNIVNGLKATQN
jgi:hypothetical protein